MRPLLAANNAGPDWAFIAALVAITVVLSAVCMLPFVFFLLTLRKALRRCRPRNRMMEPGAVWLNLIPLFGLVWQFITVNRVAESLRYEFRDRRWHYRGEDYGQGLGTAYCAILCAAFIPYCGTLFAMAGLVCWIIYWVKIAGFSSQLESGYDDQYDDDRPRRRRDDGYDDYDRDDDDRRDDDYDDRRDRKPWER